MHANTILLTQRGYNMFERHVLYYSMIINYVAEKFSRFTRTNSNRVTYYSTLTPTITLRVVTTHSTSLSQYDFKRKHTCRTRIVGRSDGLT